MLRQGFLFPRSGIESPTTHHCMLAARFLSEKDFRAFGVLTPLRLLLPPNKEFHWDKLMGEINQSPSHSIILSSENFSLINNLQPLKERLSGFNVKIIIHLRRQDKFYGSLYNQLLKTPFTGIHTTLNEFVQDRQLEGDSYQSILDRWSNAFGKSNMIVKPYEREQLDDGLLSDFASTIGFKTKSFLGVNSKHNISLPRHAIKFIQLIKKSSITESILLNKEIGTFLYELSKKPSIEKSNSTLPAPLAVEVNNFHAAENEYIAKEYLNRNDGKLFYSPNPKEDASSEDIENTSNEELINEIVAPLLLRLTSKNEALSTKIINVRAIKPLLIKIFSPPKLFTYAIKVYLYARCDRLKLVLFKLKNRVSP